MAPLKPADSFRALLNDTASERTQVRSLVARGRWLESDQPERAKAFMARRSAGTVPRGAEALQGDTIDFQSASFLVEGAQVRRAVGYVEVNTPGQSRLGSGFLIGAGLFVTNCHVIGTEADALAATVTFDRELDPRLIPTATTTFRLDPQRLFLCSKVDELDFAVIAVGERLSGPAALDDLGFCPLSPADDKHTLGMNVNVIQHPNGTYKQVAIRNNLLTHRTDRSLLYETDTEVGSSGAPVFNDSWDVIALHHWGEPYLAKLDEGDATQIPVHVNEGVRSSVIHAALSAELRTLAEPQRALLAQALALWQQVPAGGSGRLLSPARPNAGGSARPESAVIGSDTAPASVVTSAGGVPLEVTVRLGGGVAQPAALGAPLPLRQLVRAAEAVRVDTNYAKRRGYDAKFLPGTEIALPVLDDRLAKQLQPLRAGEANAADGELKYEHFSIKVNRDRRIAIFTATNIDGDSYRTVDRKTGLVTGGSEGETWYKDPRVSESAYLGLDFYSGWSAYFDRGHLTRRTDPTWGSDGAAERANADTFHFTNCSPQHFRFNQSAKYWQGLERYVLENGLLAVTGEQARLCVFQGPLFDDSIDLWADDVQIPSSYWKLVMWKFEGKLKSVGLIADQLQLLSEPRTYLGQPKPLPFVDVSQWRVPVAAIAKRSGLAFDPAVVAADTYDGPQPQPGAEAQAAKRIGDWRDIAL